MKLNFQKIVSRKHSTLIDDIVVIVSNNYQRFFTLTGFHGGMRNLLVLDGDYMPEMNWFNAVMKNHSHARVDFFGVLFEMAICTARN